MKSLAIRSPFPGAVCFFVDETESTMSEARALARMGAASGSLVAADYQRSGRGRLAERRWESERGANLLVTLRLDADAVRYRALPLRVGVALCQAVEAYAERSSAVCPSPPRIKWPNDVLLGGRKAAGVLCEAKPEGAEAGVYVGFGINCNQTMFPPELRRAVTSLARELERPIDRWLLLELVLERFEAALSFPAWKEEVVKRLWHRDETVGFAPGAPGSRPPTVGRLQGVDDEGRLLILPRGESAPLAFASGEILGEGEAS